MRTVYAERPLVFALQLRLPSALLMDGAALPSDTHHGRLAVQRSPWARAAISKNEDEL